MIEAGRRQLGEAHTVSTVAEIRAALCTVPENVQIYERTAATGFANGSLPKLTITVGTVTAGKVLLTTSVSLRTFR